MVQADVEPDGRIERAILMQAHPGEVTVEVFAVFQAGEVAVGDAPVGDGAGHTMDHLLDAGFALGGSVFTVEVLATRRHWWPAGSTSRGISQLVCSNRTLPFSSLIAAVR